MYTVWFWLSTNSRITDYVVGDSEATWIEGRSTTITHNVNQYDLPITATEVCWQFIRNADNLLEILNLSSAYKFGNRAGYPRHIIGEVEQGFTRKELFTQLVGWRKE